MPAPSSRVDQLGRAYAGSQLQLQIYVNRRPNELADRVLAGLIPRPEAGLRLEWKSPLEGDLFSEYYDSAFLQAIELPNMADRLGEFWPGGGPHWDALGVLRSSTERWSGVVLVEGKSHPDESWKSPCGASPASRKKIVSALDRAKFWLKVSEQVNWTGHGYQLANRLAHLYWLRKVVNVPAWLVYACFLDDRHSPTTREAWEAAASAQKEQLGLPRAVPFLTNLYIPARDRCELVAPPA